MSQDNCALDPMQRDVLQEVSNIGVGNAATALSQLVQRRVDMSVPQVRVLPFDGVPELVGGAESIVAGIFLEVQGDLRADLLLLLPWEETANLLRLLLHQEVDLEGGFSDLEASAMDEIGNILANAFLNALSQFAGITLHPSVPARSVDMAAAVLSMCLARLGLIGEQAIVIDTVFTGGDQGKEEIRGYFLFIPGPDQLQQLFQVLGVAPE